MKYINAAEILPENLVLEIQKHVNGQLIYIPKTNESKEWGMLSGARTYYSERNKMIKDAYEKGESMDDLAERYGLARSTIRNIIYQNIL